jgi:hypothetical protein
MGVRLSTVSLATVSLAVLVLLAGCGAAKPGKSSNKPVRVKLAASMEQLKLPTQGMTFTEAQDLLLKQGAVLAPDKVSSPHPEYKELDCGGQGDCRALFVWTDKEGWGHYIVVMAGRGAAPLVTDADWAKTADGLPNIPPPASADIPTLPKDYAAARKSGPATASSTRACLKWRVARARAWLSAQPSGWRPTRPASWRSQPGASRSPTQFITWSGRSPRT